MKKLILWIGLLTFCSTYGFGDLDAKKIEPALTAALSPEKPKFNWMPVISNGSATKDEMNESMGSNNFTSFLLLLGKNDLDKLAKEYDWELESNTFNQLALMKYLGKNSTLVAWKDTSALKFTKQPDGSYAGSISINLPYKLMATLLFVAREDNDACRITKLAVAKKKSTDISKGFTVFEKK